MPTPKFTNEIIEAAIVGFEAQKQRIDAQIAELRANLSGPPPVSDGTEAVAHKPRRKFSAHALKRMREAQKLRWAKVRGESAPPAAMAPVKAKRTLSKAGRAAIVAALKKRWAAKKAASKAKPVARKSAVKKTAATKAAAKKTSAASQAHPAAEA